jgi:hypothetical protein
MRAIIITIGACLLVGGISMAVRHALDVQQHSFAASVETGALWYALGGPTPDRVAWLGADGFLGSFLTLPLDLVLMIIGGCIVVIGITSRSRR